MEHELTALEQKLQDRLNKLSGMKAILDTTANNFIVRNGDWRQAEQVDSEIAFILSLSL